MQSDLHNDVMLANVVPVKCGGLQCLLNVPLKQTPTHYIAVNLLSIHPSMYVM